MPVRRKAVRIEFAVHPISPADSIALIPIYTPKNTTKLTYFVAQMWPFFFAFKEETHDFLEGRKCLSTLQEGEHRRDQRRQYDGRSDEDPVLALRKASFQPRAGGCQLERGADSPPARLSPDSYSVPVLTPQWKVTTCHKRNIVKPRLTPVRRASPLF